MGGFAGLGNVFSGGGASGIGTSANQSTQSTDNKNNAISGENASIFDTRGGSISFNSLDAGVIDRAFDFAADYVGVTAAATSQTLEAYAQQSRGALDELVKFSTEQNKSSVQQLTESVFKTGVYALLGLAGLLALYGFTQRKKAA